MYTRPPLTASQRMLYLRCLRFIYRREHATGRHLKNPKSLERLKHNISGGYITHRDMRKAELKLGIYCKRDGLIFGRFY